jgi:hypothetical protein
MFWHNDMFPMNFKMVKKSFIVSCLKDYISSGNFLINGFKEGFSLCFGRYQLYLLLSHYLINLIYS